MEPSGCLLLLFSYRDRVSSHHTLAWKSLLTLLGFTSSFGSWSPFSFCTFNPTPSPPFLFEFDVPFFLVSLRYARASRSLPYSVASSSRSFFWQRSTLKVIFGDYFFFFLSLTPSSH